MKLLLLAAMLLSAASSAFAQAAPAGRSQEQLTREMVAWRAINFSDVSSRDPEMERLKTRLDALQAAVKTADTPAKTAGVGKDFDAWKKDLLGRTYAIASSRGLARGSLAQYSNEQTRMAEFSADLRTSLAQAVTTSNFERGSRRALSAGVLNPIHFFDGADARRSGFDFGPSVVAAPPAYASGDPARYAKVRSILISQGASRRVVDLAIQEAIRQNADPLLVLAVIKAESGFDPNATSGVGARGLMQIMPETGRDLGVRDSGRLYDAQTNLHAGVRFLKSLWGQFVGGSMTALAGINPFDSHGVKAAVAAYNAGPGAVAKYGGVPPYRETQGYVKNVLGYYNQLKRYMNV